MNYAFTNGKILDGTKDMQVQTGLCILVQDGTITDIVPDIADLAGYKTIDLQGRYIMARTHQHACASCRKWKAAEKAARQ